MNVLYYDFLNLEDHGTESVHIYEVLSNLSNLGHNVVLLNKGCLTNAGEIHLSQQPSLWRAIGSSLRSLPIFKFLEGEVFANYCVQLDLNTEAFDESDLMLNNIPWQTILRNRVSEHASCYRSSLEDRNIITF